MTLLCFEHRISLSAKHVPGVLNVLADALIQESWILYPEWTLSHKVLSPFWELWFKPLVDLFDMRFNHRLPIYVSPVVDPEAWVVDVLTFPGAVWRRKNFLYFLS